MEEGVTRLKALAVKARGVGASLRLTVEEREGVWAWVREEGVWDLAEGVWDREAAEEVEVEDGPERERCRREEKEGVSTESKKRLGNE